MSISARLRSRLTRLVATSAMVGAAFAGVAVVQAPQASAASSVDGTITASEVIARAWDWVNRRPYIKYDASGNTSAPDVSGRNYRPDCSGAVSMAWHLGTSLTTATLPGRAPNVISSSPSSSTDLRPGDLLNVNNGNGHHAVLFDHWEPDHVHFSVFTFGGGADGNSPPTHETGRTFSGTVGGHPGNVYTAYRYDKVVQDGGDLGVLEYYLSDSQGSSVATRPVIYYGNSPQIPIVGDWNGDGVDTVSTYDPTTSTFYISDNPVTGNAERVIRYGDPGAQPLVGDWDGDGKDNIGVKMGFTYYMRTGPVSGAVENTVTVAFGDAPWLPVVGDWNGDGKDTISAYNPANGNFLLSDNPANGVAQYVIAYGNPNAIPLVGDWDGDGKDNIGVKMGATYYMRTGAVTGAIENTRSIGYGNTTGDLPVIGDWNGDGIDTQGLAR
ncbi:hypothetical protein OG589_22125 [Sphaerisporangium sp. NBC_01403]|uniref:hypothetical protein n=1 Tax=Sphaerisporangium sp. NBC_01403 TaxID=2903599 RepID=UPI003250FFB8